MARVTVRETPTSGANVPDRIAFSCFFLSGLLGLIYEIAWIKKASLVFGSASYALSTVVAVFFGGLALGSFVFGRASAGIDRPLRLYAKLEIALGALALATPTLFALCDLAYGSVYPAAYESFSSMTLLRLALTSIAILPATFLMGATLPLFCRQYVTQATGISRSVGFLYGLNTLGAAVGCFLAGFILLPMLGVNTSIYAAGVLNVGIGVVIWSLARDTRAQGSTQKKTAKHSQGKREASTGGNETAAATARQRGVVAFLFFVSGAVILANEILWARFLTLLTRNTVYTYTLTLGVILLGIVIGSWVMARHFDDSEKRAQHFGSVQILTGLSVLLVLLLPASWWRTNLIGADGEAGLLTFGFVLLGPAILSGIAFPLAVRMVVDQPWLASVGVGKMTALNTFGGIVGSLLAGFVMLPTLGLHASVRVTTGASLVLGLAAWFLIDGARDRPKKLFLSAVSLGVWFLLPNAMGTRLPDDFLLKPGDRAIAVAEGRNANLAVLERNGVRILEIDRLWQGEARKTHQIMAAHIPMLVHPSPKDIAVIGLGTGQTASRFLYYDIARLDCVDIESELPGIVREHFDADWLDDSRVRFLAEDGRNYLSYTDQQYDVISVEVGQTFRPGVGSFYTREFYEHARQRLSPDGLLCQFVPIMFLSQDECRGVVNTFIDVFPEASLWYNTGELLLVGTNASSFRISGERLKQAIARPLVNEDLEWAHWGGRRERLNTPDTFLGAYLMGAGGLFKIGEGGEIFRDDLPLLDYSVSGIRAPRDEILITDRIAELVEPVTDVLDSALGLDLNRIQGMRDANLQDVRGTSIGRAGFGLFATGKYAQAREVLRRALRVSTRNVAIRLYLGDTHMALGRTNDALREYQTALGVDPDRIPTHQRLAQAYEKQDNKLLALRHYQSLSELQPESYDAALAYGRMRIDAGDPAGGIEVLRPWSEREDAELEFQLGRAYYARRNREDARVHYQRCLELAPERVEARVNLGNLYRDLGKTEEAIEEYQLAIRVRPTLIQAHYNLSVAFSREERYDEAIESGQNVLRLDDEFYAGYDHLGTMYYRTGSYKKAVQMYERAIEIKPDFSNAVNNLARAKAKLGG